MSFSFAQLIHERALEPPAQGSHYQADDAYCFFFFAKVLK